MSSEGVKTPCSVQVMYNQPHMGGGRKSKIFYISFIFIYLSQPSVQPSVRHGGLIRRKVPSAQCWSTLRAVLATLRTLYGGFIRLVFNGLTPIFVNTPYTPFVFPGRKIA